MDRSPALDAGSGDLLSLLQLSLTSFISSLLSLARFLNPHAFLPSIDFLSYLAPSFSVISAYVIDIPKFVS